MPEQSETKMYLFFAMIRPRFAYSGEELTKRAEWEAGLEQAGELLC